MLILQVYVDETKQTVILPIYGSAVPFHISTIKNVTKTEEGSKVVLRINFQSPGQIAGKKEDMVGSLPFRQSHGLLAALRRPRCDIHPIRLVPIRGHPTHDQSLREHHGAEEGRD